MYKYREIPWHRSSSYELRLYELEYKKYFYLESHHNISVNAIAPGGVATPGTNFGKMPDEFSQAFLAKIPMHRMADADEIGKVALFLASDLSSYMTGSQVVVDGGTLLA